ncbi:NADPH:quinone reductase [Urbifossiella limnaea]|uniref:Quinone oxidoreductase 1 n=1 Tax=Urbifossiella limnaea TaxID=2528023 RepID=A0A517XMD0_9BACT|nr:NADPH:quinone reductase [Urbifossiella limnaea]QDU18636.1 Quinone oxidoreductase 1 [Urbifossiella limnaea]
MKAAFLDQPGPPEVIRTGELPTPTPGAGEVLVRVTAASVNPIDTYIRAGLVAMTLPRPFIPGCDLAGVVEAVGAGVKRFHVGDRVWGSNQGLLGRQGTFAEYAAVGEQWLYPTPTNVADEQAAAAALVGITAHLGLFGCAKLHAGDTVFVNGGTGGVGSMVIQMAKAAGARVVTTVGSAEKATLAAELGADAVINYKTDDVAAKVKEAAGGAGITVWYETQPPTDLDRTVELMAPRGRVVVMAGRAARPVFPNGPFYVKGLSLHGFAMFNATPDEQRVCGADLAQWLGQGKIKALIGARFPLADAAKAHALQEENTGKKAGTLTGKIVVLPSV